MRLAFMGSPEFAVPALEALHAAGHEIAAVYCQPPRPAHRGQKPNLCPVHERALGLGLMVRTPVRLRRDLGEQQAFAALRLDAAVVAAYGLILPPAMLEAPRLGCLNIHASLLPRWRGAAPIQAAILAGDAVSGITVMRMDAGLDTGPMLLQEGVPIAPRMSAWALRDALAPVGAALILRALDESPPPVPQPEAGATYAGKLSRQDGVLDFSRDAGFLDRQVRAFDPWPGTFTYLRGQRLKVLEAEPEDASGPPGALLADREHGLGSGLWQGRTAPAARSGAGAHFRRGARLPARQHNSARHCSRLIPARAAKQKLLDFPRGLC